MTNFERIKNAETITDMARRNIKTRFDPYFICITSDGKIFKLSEKQLAIHHEITWLNSESEMSE